MKKGGYNVLIGAVTGAIISLPLLGLIAQYVNKTQTYPTALRVLFYPAELLGKCLTDLFFPGVGEMAGLVFGIPCLVLYCAGRGALLPLLYMKIKAIISGVSKPEVKHD